MPAPKVIAFAIEAEPNAEYWAKVDSIEAGEIEKPRPGFRKMIEWGLAEEAKRGVKYSHLAHMRNSYKKHTGLEVDIF